jgi:GAF domain-containing protein
VDSGDKDRQLGAVVVDLTDTLVRDFDVVEVATRVVHHCTGLLGVHSAGLLLADAHGELQLLAATSEETRVVETFQVEGGDGPCIEAFRTDRPVSADAADEIDRRWPYFAAAARAEGIVSVYAVPLRLRGRPIGSLNLFLTVPGSLPEGDRHRAAVLGDIATLAITQAETVRDRDETVRQLQHALDSRVVIEQAKGVLVASTGCGVDEAFAALRAQARSANRKLVDVARDVVARRLGAAELRPQRSGA